MLANYARAKGEFEAVDGDAVLAEYPDASVVSDWAKDSVAWLRLRGHHGGGASILPAGSILRMRAATMAVNAQPEKADDALITIPSVNAPAEDRVAPQAPPESLPSGGGLSRALCPTEPRESPNGSKQAVSVAQGVTVPSPSLLATARGRAAHLGPGRRKRKRLNRRGRHVPPLVASSSN